MGESFALLLFLVLTIGLAAPLLPLARRLARQSINTWKDVVLVIAFMSVLGFVTFSPAGMLGAAFVLLILPALQLILGMFAPHIGQGAVIFIFVWVGMWAVAVFCAACWATAFVNDWWNRRSG